MAQDRIATAAVVHEQSRSAICDGLSAGLDFRAACRMAEVDPRVAEALRRGDRVFAEACRKATAEAETRALQAVTAAASIDWRAAAWLLERLNPNRWAKRDE